MGFKKENYSVAIKCDVAILTKLLHYLNGIVCNTCKHHICSILFNQLLLKKVICAILL